MKSNKQIESQFQLKRIGMENDKKLQNTEIYSFFRQ